MTDNIKERPILFSSAMVRALLRDEDPKTQTRRVFKQAVGPSLSVDCDERGVAELSWLHGDGPGHEVHERIERLPCPYGVPGDHLYVRETWQHSNHPFGPYEPDCDVFYRADYLDDPLGPDLERSKDGIRRQWRPSIHMPRAASRITLEVTGVRVERLQDIGESDAQAEGVGLSDDQIYPYTFAFATLWEQLNGKGSWSADPYVWVVEFKRIEVK